MTEAQVDGFNHQRLDLARRRRGLTRRALSEAVGITPQSLSRYASGARQPAPEIAKKFAKVLRFPPSFFFGEELEEADRSGPSFRALTRMTSAQRDRAVAAGTLGMHLADWIDQRFELPEPAIPQYRHPDPEAAAMEVRMRWGLGEQPIKNIVRLLEYHGVRIFAMSEDTRNIDAYSFWREDSPYVFLDVSKTAERSRMDAAHELGHLVLHAVGGSQRSRQAENEANQFGSAFLMPRGSVLGRMPPGATLRQIIASKQYWGVSVVNLTYRLHSLNMLSKHHYTSMFIEIGRRNYRTREPEPMERETSQVLEQVFGLLRESGVSLTSVADELCLYPEDVGNLLHGLVRFPVPIRTE